MRRILRETMLFIAVFCAVSTISHAEEYTVKDIKVAVPGIKLFLNDQPQSLSADPFIYENRVYIPLDAVSKMMGSEITLDPGRPYIYISRPGDDPLEIGDTKGYDYMNEKLSRPYSSYEVDSRQEEIDRLRYELAREKKKNDYDDYDDDDDEDLEDMEDDIRDDYDRYTKGDRTLEFDIRLSWSSGDVKVEMEGDFDRNDSRYWDDRDDGEFRDYIEDMCEDIADEFEEDVRVYVEDEDGDRLARYEYDYKDEDLDREYER